MTSVVIAYELLMIYHTNLRKFITIDLALIDKKCVIECLSTVKKWIISPGNGRRNYIFKYTQDADKRLKCEIIG